MLFDYKKVTKYPTCLTLADGKTIEGEFILGLRIDANTLPRGKDWSQIRHSDNDVNKPASLKNGCVVVNFYGTFICDRFDNLACGQELEIIDYSCC